MITSFEVGAVFRIQDQASAPLRSLITQMRELDRLTISIKKNIESLGKGTEFRRLASGIGAVNKEMRDLAGSSAQVASSFQAGFAAMNAELAASRTLLREMAAEMRGLRGAMPRMPIAPGVVPGGGGRRPRGPGGGGWHMAPHERMGPMMFRGPHVSGLGMGALAAAGIAGYGAFEEAQFEDAAFRAMYTAGVPVDRMQQSKQFRQLRDLVQQSAARTGFSVHDIEEATLIGIRQFAGMPWDKRMQVMPQLLEASATEARLKGEGTTLSQGMEAFTGLAHMTKFYSPEEIAKLAPKFAYLSATSPMKLKQIETSASYGVPFLQSGLGVDPFDIMLLQTAMQRSGVLSTKSGTWIREMVTRAMPGTSFMSKIAFQRHEKALRQLGLVDAHGKPTWFTEGKPDPLKEIEIVGEKLPTLPLAQRAGAMRALLGTQGMSALAVLSDPKIREQIHNLRGEMLQFKVGEGFFEGYQKESPSQQFRVAWADTQNILMDIGEKVLPTVNAGLKMLDDTLKSIKGMLPDGKKPGEDVHKHALTGAAVGGTAGFVLGGPLGAVIGAGVGALGVTGLAGDLSAAARRRPLAEDSGNLYFQDGVVVDKALVGASIPLLEQRYGKQGAAATPPASNVTMTNNITVKGDWDGLQALANKIAGMLVGILRNSTQTTQGPGQGISESPYSSGRFIGE